MKVLELCMSKGVGGLELYLLKVAKYLVNNNYQCQAITRSDSFLAKEIDSHGITNTKFNFVFHHLPILSALKIARYITNNQVDVVHIHWGKDVLLAVLAKVFSKRKVKLVYTRQMALTRKKYDAYHRFIYRNIDKYLVITRKLYQQAKEFLPLNESQVDVLYYGVPAAKLDNDICGELYHKLGVDKSITKVAIFGRIEEGKGQHLVIDAVHNILKSGEQLHLSLVGHIMDQGYFKSLEKYIVDNNIKSNVTYYGFHNNPTSIMPCFDIVILATRCETFGLVLPEAMRAGAAVIGSDCGGVPEIIEHGKTGLLFEPQSSADLTRQLECLVKDPGYRNNLAHAGKSYADKMFSEESHFTGLLKYFNEGQVD